MNKGLFEIDHFGIRQRIIDYYVSCGSTVNLCALDVSKAFDRMNHHGSSWFIMDHHGLFVKLMNKHVPNNLLMILECWFQLGKTCIKWCNVMTSFLKSHVV